MFNLKYNYVQQSSWCAMYKRNLVSFGLALAVAGLSGCASVLSVTDQTEFACPGMPGIMCKTPKQVYNSTHKALPTMANASAAGSKPGVAANSVMEGQMPHVVQQPFMLQPISGAPLPLREPSRVLRIWIGPWIETKTDNLHWPTYIYTEVQPRKWTVGDPDFRTMRAGMPLTMRPSVAQTPVRSGAAQSVDGAGNRPAPQPKDDSAESNNSTQPYE